jgi:hypothetical protein
MEAISPSAIQSWGECPMQRDFPKAQRLAVAYLHIQVGSS